MSTPIQRYFAKNNDGYVPQSDGPLVTYEDHARTVSELHQQMGELEAILIPADPQFDASSDHATPHARIIACAKRIAAGHKLALSYLPVFAKTWPSVILGSSPYTQEEGYMWDRYLSAALSMGKAGTEAANFADEMVAERRKRFPSADAENRRRLEEMARDPAPHGVAAPYVPKAGDRVVYAFKDEKPMHGRISPSGNEFYAEVSPTWTVPVKIRDIPSSGTFRPETEADRKASA